MWKVKLTSNNNIFSILDMFQSLQYIQRHLSLLSTVQVQFIIQYSNFLGYLNSLSQISTCYQLTCSIFLGVWLLETAMSEGTGVLRAGFRYSMSQLALYKNKINKFVKQWKHVEMKNQTSNTILRQMRTACREIIFCFVALIRYLVTPENE